MEISAKARMEAKSRGFLRVWSYGGKSVAAHVRRCAGAQARSECIFYLHCSISSICRGSSGIISLFYMGFSHACGMERLPPFLLYAGERVGSSGASISL